MNEITNLNNELIEFNAEIKSIEKNFNENEIRLINNAKAHQELQIKQELSKPNKKGEYESPTLKSIKANPAFYANALRNFVDLGLDLGNKEAYILPYGTTPTAIIDWKGLKKILLKYSIIKILDIKAENVYSNDEFSYNDGELTHKFNPFLNLKERGDFMGSYAKVIREDGLTDYHFCSKEEIEKIKNMSSSMKDEEKKKYSPWTKFPEEMYKKTVIRKAFKNYPIDAQKENFAEILENADNDVVLERENVIDVQIEKKKESLKKDPEKEQKRKELLDFCQENNFNIGQIAQNYNLNEKSTAQDFENALNSLKGN